MPSQIIAATTQYPLGGTNPSAGSLITFKTVGLTASCSVIPKVRKPGDGTSNLVSIPYLNVGTNATIAAGTAITADGVYQIAAVGPENLLDATVSAGTATIHWWIVEGLGGSGGSGGGGGGSTAVTVANGADVALGSTTDTAVTNPASTATLIAATKGTNSILQAAPTAAVPVVIQNAGLTATQPLGDSNADAIFVYPSHGTKSTVAQVSVTTGNTLVLAANSARKSCIIANNGTATIYLGNTGVTSSTGLPLAAGATLTDSTTNDAWYAISSTGTNAACVIEVS